MSINIASEIVHFGGHVAGSPAPAAVPICPAWVVSGIECGPVQRVQRPGVCALPCVVCPGICPPWFWHGLPCCLCCAVCPGALGLGSPPAGYMGRAGGGVVDTSRRKNSKKALLGIHAANTHPTFTNQNSSDCASLQIFRKNKKTPSRSLDCGIIS